MRTLISAIVLFNIIPVYCQEIDNYKISIHEVSSVSLENRKFELLKGNNQNLIVFINLLNQRQSLNEKDSVRAISLLDRNDKESQTELFAIMEKTLIYAYDTIHIQKEDPIFKVADSFSQNRITIKKQLEENKDRRIILDGINFTIKVEGPKGDICTFYARSPTEDSHPDIFKLITNITKI